MTIIYVAVFLLIAFMGLTPQGRAFAQSIYKFFATTNQSSLPLSQEEVEVYYSPVPAYTLSLVDVTPVSLSSDPCSNSEGTGTYECEIQDAEKQLNMELKEFSTVPSGWVFRGVDLYSTVSSGVTGNVAEIWYQTSGGYLFLRQGNGDFPQDIAAVLESAVEQVKVGEYYGEYVNGGFGVRNGETNSTWNATGSDQRIRWQEGARWFEILELSGSGTTGYMDKQTLISLASSMVYHPKNMEESVKINPDYIPNIPLAERICGCTIVHPTKLPAHMEFDYARYDSQQKSVTLNYGYRALRIVQTPKGTALFTSLDSYKNVETFQFGDVAGQYAVSPIQKTIWDSATPPAFPVTNTYSVLLWEKDGVIYQIYFDQSYSNGGQLTKEQMIEIAESLQ